jgi:hypothetical protein
LLYTDGYPPYPSTARNYNFNHHAVNYSEDFRAVDGTHSNNIEGFWVHLKRSMGQNMELTMIKLINGFFNIFLGVDMLLIAQIKNLESYLKRLSKCFLK